MKSRIDSLSPSKITFGLKTKKFGKIIHYFKRVTSTMDIARELVEKGEPEGSIVIAESQLSGRGRFQRKWSSPFGGIYFSLILRPTFLPKDVPKINFLTTVAVAKTLRELYWLNANTKWPNDVLIEEKKICGILTETGMEGKKLNWVILGIGINANLEIKALPRKCLIQPTSLKVELKRSVSLQRIIRKLLKNLENEYFLAERTGFNSVLEKWKTFSTTLGRKVKIVTSEKGYSGKAIDIDREGALILRFKNGKKRKFFTGDCIHLE